MGKKIRRDTIWDSLPAWIAIILMALLPLIFWITGLTNYGIDSRKTEWYNIAIGFIAAIIYFIGIIKFATSKVEFRWGHGFLLLAILIIEWLAFISWDTNW